MSLLLRFLKTWRLLVLRTCIVLTACLIHLRAAAQDTTLLLADPTMFYHKGVYYLYGTVEGRTAEGFQVYTAANQKDWRLSQHTKEGYALQKGDAFGQSGFWAPQVFAYRDSFYMAYVANEQIAIAVGNHPAGPFLQQHKQPLAAPVKQIDPFVFFDDDGKKYLYHVRLDSGNKIFVGELLDDFSGIKPETVKECIKAEEPWENTAGAPWPVAEGPSVIKLDGVYYLFYTANDFRNPDYAVGYAVASTPYGPWKKFKGNPILSKRTIGQDGPGHGDFIKQDDNKWWYVFHTHHALGKPTPRRTAIIQVTYKKSNRGFSDASFQVQPKSFRFLLPGSEKP